MVETDLSVFFDADDFAVQVTRTRPATADVGFPAIVGASDDDALLGRSTAAVRRLHWAAGPDIKEHDVLVIAEASGPLARFNGSYEALEVRRHNDGAEMVCELRKTA